MGHSHLSKGIGRLTLEGRVAPCDHVVSSLKDDWLSARGLATEEGAFPRGLREGWGGAKRGWAPARNGSAVASRPSLPLSRTCHKGVARCGRPLPRVGPGAGEVSAVARPRCSWETTGDAEPGGVGDLGTSVREGNRRPGLRRGNPTGAGGDSRKGPGRERRWAEPRKQPGGSPLRPVAEGA